MNLNCMVKVSCCTHNFLHVQKTFSLHFLQGNHAKKIDRETNKIFAHRFDNLAISKARYLKIEVFREFKRHAWKIFVEKILLKAWYRWNNP